MRRLAAECLGAIHLGLNHRSQLHNQSQLYNVHFLQPLQVAPESGPYELVWPIRLWLYWFTRKFLLHMCKELKLYSAEDDKRVTGRSMTYIREIITHYKQLCTVY